MALDFAIPGDMATLTGGYGYNRRLIAGLEARGRNVRVLGLPDCFPDLTVGAAVAARAALSAAHAPLMVDSLALCALPPEIAAALPHPLIALVHHPLGLENGLSPALAAHLVSNERAVLALCDHVLVTSAMTAARLVVDFGVEPCHISVAEPGTDARSRAQGSGRTAQQGPLLVAAGSVVPRKGHDILVAAMARLPHMVWSLDIIGSLTRDPACASKLQAQISANSLGSRITLRGEYAPETLAAAMARADIFVMPSLYEGFGMALTEALAAGLAVVSSDGGALAATLPQGAGLMVAAGDVQALAAALARVIGDAPLRSRFAEAAWLAGQTLPGWDDTVNKVAAMLQGVGA